MNEKRRLILWLFENRCAACGCELEPTENAELHHNTYPRLHGGERPQDIIPLCWGCHPIFEVLRTGGSLKFKASVRDFLKRYGRLRRTLDQASEWAERYVLQLNAMLDEPEYCAEFLQAMADRWDEENGEKRRVA